MRGIISKKAMLLFLVLCFFAVFTSCSKKDKETVISADVSKQVQAEESEIQEKIELGNKYLQQGKYEDAKKTYEDAIIIDNGDKETYISIKDSYLAKNRLDDAIYIIKLAIDNKIDIDNMKAIIDEIKKKFEMINLECVVFQNDSFTLPKETSIKLNNENTLQVPIKWSSSVVDTSKTGTFTYEGSIEQYERTVKLTLEVKPIIKERKIGYISRVYEANGKRYLSFNEVQFFLGEQALIEAKKDGKGANFTGGCYVRDKDDEFAQYEIDDNADLYLLGSMIDTVSDDITNKPVTYIQFKDIVNNESHLLYWIDVENGKITMVQGQFTQ